MNKSHDAYRVDVKRRLATLLEGRGKAAAKAREAGIPKTSVYTWIGEAKKAVPDIVDGYFLAKSLGETVESIVTGKEPEGLSPRILTLSRQLSQLPEYDLEEIEALVQLKVAHRRDDVAKTSLSG